MLVMFKSVSSFKQHLILVSNWSMQYCDGTCPSNCPLPMRLPVHGRPPAACLLDIQNLEDQNIQNLESQDIQSIGIQKLSSDFVSIKLHVTQSGTEVWVSRTTTL